jgi:hypothetical protein
MAGAVGGMARDGGDRAPANPCFQAALSSGGADCGYRAAADWLLNLSAWYQAKLPTPAGWGNSPASGAAGG